MTRMSGSLRRPGAFALLSAGGSLGAALALQAVHHDGQHLALMWQMRDWVHVFLAALTLSTVTLGLGWAAVLVLWRACAVSHLMRSARSAAVPPPAKLARARAALGSVPVLYLDDPWPRVLAAGVCRPGIVVTRGAVERLDTAELKAVLLHEEAHVRHLDPLKLLLLPLWTRGLFYLPAAAALGRQYAFSKESAADRYAIACTGPLPLLSALRKLLVAGWAAGSRASLVPGATDELAWRIERLGGQHLDGVRQHFLSPATFAMTLLGATLLLMAASITCH